MVGDRSFGPLLAVIGLVAASPLGLIPTLPSILALGTGLVAAQLLVGMPRIWLPRFLLARSVDRERLAAAVDRVRPMTRRIDRVLRPRLTIFASGVFVRVIAALCLLLAVLIPPLELLPPSWRRGRRLRSRRWGLRYFFATVPSRSSHWHLRRRVSSLSELCCSSRWPFTAQCC